LTRFWVRLVGHVMGAFPAIDRFDDLVAAWPRIADKGLPGHHYQGATLTSAAARLGWVEPDLLPLP
jgi:hypothetical protein